MDHFDLRGLDVAPSHPQILQSDRGEGRAIALHLAAGEQLQEHEQHERAYVVVVDGEIEVTGEGTATGGSGSLFVFAPHERREITARTGTRLLMINAPWPGPGHPGARDD